MAMERLADTSTPGIHLEGGVRERSEIAYLQPSAAVNAEWNHFNETKTIKKLFTLFFMIIWKRQVINLAWKNPGLLGSAASLVEELLYAQALY